MGYWLGVGLVFGCEGTKAVKVMSRDRALASDLVLPAEPTRFVSNIADSSFIIENSIFFRKDYSKT